MAVRVGGWVREGGGLRLAPLCRLTAVRARRPTEGRRAPEVGIADRAVNCPPVIGRQEKKCGGLFIKSAA